MEYSGPGMSRGHRLLKDCLNNIDGGDGGDWKAEGRYLNILFPVTESALIPGGHSALTGAGSRKGAFTLW